MGGQYYSDNCTQAGNDRASAMSMVWIVGGLLALHGLIHLMGFAKAFGDAQLPQLTQPISRPMGVAWMAASILVLASAVLLAARGRYFWVVGAVAALVSQAVIISAWRDAWAGTAGNVLLVMVVGYAWLTVGPRSFHAQFERQQELGLAREREAPLVSDADLEQLPGPVQQYLHLTGAAGQPRIRNYRLRFRGRIRSAPDARWMPFEAVQQSFADEPTRLFLMRARMYGVPVEAFHCLVGGHATMTVKLAGLIPMVDARGDVMDRSETVTLFNDMCVLAPGTLLDSGITWGPVDGRTVHARFKSGEHTIAATLSFGEDGLLENFTSDDRSRSSPNGKTFTQLRFSTPVGDYRVFGAARLAARGEARWHLPEGGFTYGEFELVEVAYNVHR